MSLHGWVMETLGSQPAIAEAFDFRRQLCAGGTPAIKQQIGFVHAIFPNVSEATHSR
jgi:hypothetical protein